MQSEDLTPVIIDNTTLWLKIDRLFAGDYGQFTENTNRTHIIAVDAFDEIINWGESEFGLSQNDRQMLEEIIENFECSEDSSFTKDDLFKHLRGLEIPKSKLEPPKPYHIDHVPFE